MQALPLRLPFLKYVHTEYLIAQGPVAESEEWRALHAKVLDAVGAVVWPPGASDFTIRKESGKKRGQGSGVKPIKSLFLSTLQSVYGYLLEQRLPWKKVRRSGPLDALTSTPIGAVAVEWETGNVSSSHRALNKMAAGLLEGTLVAGVLVLPTRSLAQYLTDRIGNYEELVPFFIVWQSLPVKNGVLAIVSVEHDRACPHAPRIPKATDGRALA